VQYASVEGELNNLLSHDNPLYRNDNANVFERLEEGLRGTALTSVLVKHRKKRDGRSAFFALKAQHAGKAVWDQRITDGEDGMKQRRWTGTSNVTLASLIEKQRSSYVGLTEAAEHVDYQLPNEHTRVTYLLKSIEDCKDAKVQAAASAIDQDDNGMRADFEKAAAKLLPTCPVKRRGKTAKRPGADIASIDPKIDGKCPKTGVELRWYPRKEFLALNDEQKDALKAWSATQPSRRGGKAGKQTPKKGPAAGGMSKRQAKRYISSMLAKKQKSDDADGEQAEQLTQSLMGFASAVMANKKEKGTTAKVSVAEGNPQEESLPSNVAELAKVTAGQLQGILKSGPSKWRKSG
jgi:hypothetical protein